MHLPEPVRRALARCRPIQETNISPSFSTLGLRAELLRAVEEQGYTQPTPIQLAAIPAVLAGRDLLAAAQTGTGKTAGFVLPLLQLLAGLKGSPAGRRLPRTLILTPTRELAAQIEASVRAYGAHMSLTSTVVYGGVGMQPQVQALRRGVDILVSTPGRLLDHAQQKTVDLSEVKILVLDEADRMLDMGFIRDVRRILDLLPRQRQNLLFSATFTAEIRDLAGSFLHDPAVVEVAPRNAPSELVTHVVHPVDQTRKRELLAHLITENNWQQVLVFTRTKHGANRLAQQLVREGISADAIHGNKSQSHRTRTLADFKGGELRVLVATDIAARGLDIVELPHVVNFDIPHVPEDYVHRIGRTGRAGVEGDAVSLVCAEDQPLMTAIERLLRRSLESRVVPGYEPSEGQRASGPRAPAAPRRTGSGASGPRGARPRHEPRAGRREHAAPAAQHAKGRNPSTSHGKPARKSSAPASGRRPVAAASARPAQPEKKASGKLGPMAALLAGARRLIG